MRSGKSFGLAEVKWPLLINAEVENKYETAKELPSEFHKPYKDHNAHFHFTAFIVSIGWLHGICSSKKYVECFSGFCGPLNQLLQIMVTTDSLTESETLKKIDVELDTIFDSIFSRKRNSHIAFRTKFTVCILRKQLFLGSMEDVILGLSPPGTMTGKSYTPKELQDRIKNFKKKHKPSSYFHCIPHAWTYSRKSMQLGLVLSFSACITLCQSIGELINFFSTGGLNPSDRSAINAYIVMPLVYAVIPGVVFLIGLIVQSIGVCKSYIKKPSQGTTDAPAYKAIQFSEVSPIEHGEYEASGALKAFHQLVDAIKDLRKICTSKKYQPAFLKIYSALKTLLPIITKNKFDDTMDVQHATNITVILAQLVTISELRFKGNREFLECINNANCKQIELAKSLKRALSLNSTSMGEQSAGTLVDGDERQLLKKLIKKINNINGRFNIPSCCHFMPHAWTYSNKIMQAGILSSFGAIFAAVESILLQAFYISMSTFLKNTSFRLPVPVYFVIQTAYVLIPLMLGIGITVFGITTSYLCQAGLFKNEIEDSDTHSSENEMKNILFN